MPHTLADVLSVGVRERTGGRAVVDANGLPHNQPLSRESVDNNMANLFDTDGPLTWTPGMAAAARAAAVARAAEFRAREVEARAAAVARAAAARRVVDEMEAERERNHPAHLRPVPAHFRDLPSYRTVRRYVRAHGRVFSSAPAAPGDRVMSYAFARVGTVVAGGRTTHGIFHPAVVYDDEPGLANTEYATDFFAVINPGATLPPMPWM